MLLKTCSPSLTSTDFVPQDVEAPDPKHALPAGSAPAPHLEESPQCLTTESTGHLSAAQSSKLAASEVPKVASEAVSRAAAVPHVGNQEAAPPAPANMAPTPSQPMQVRYLPCRLFTCHHSSAPSSSESWVVRDAGICFGTSSHTKHFR